MTVAVANVIEEVSEEDIVDQIYRSYQSETNLNSLEYIPEGRNDLEDTLERMNESFKDNAIR